MSEQALKMVHFDQSGYLGWSDQNVPFHLKKLLSPGPLFCCDFCGGLVGVCAPECTVLLGTWNFQNFKQEFLLNGKRPRLLNLCPLSKICVPHWLKLVT